MTPLKALGWVAGTVVGLAIGGFVFHFPGSFGEFTWQPAAMVFGVLLGAINGAVVGICQWTGLGFPSGRALRLMGAMAIGIGVSHGLADGSARWIGLAGIALVGGAAVAIGYAWAFDARRASLVGASVVGWAGGWLIGDRLTEVWRMPWTQTPVGWSQEHLVVGVVVGLAWGVATVVAGLPAWILAHDTAAAPASSSPRSGAAGGIG